MFSLNELTQTLVSYLVLSHLTVARPYRATGGVQYEILLQGQAQEELKTEQMNSKFTMRFTWQLTGTRSTAPPCHGKSSYFFIV